MKIIQKGTMPDGTAIQIEDWSEDYSFHSYADTIGAYPIAKWSNDYSQFSPKAGKRFRASFTVKNAYEVFQKLESGEIALERLADYMDEPKNRRCLTGV